MRLKFKDFYQQYVEVHDEDGFGITRICVKTCKDLEKVPSTEEDACEVTTDISLNSEQLMLLLAVLNAIQKAEE